MRTAPPHYDYPAINMADNLPQQFEDFVCGATRARAFEQELLTLCATTPDSVWNVLALLDQYYRRDKLSADFCRTMRHKIERHVLGIEKFETIFASSEIAVVLPKATAGTVTAVPTEFSHRAAPTKALPSESDIFPAEDPNPREQAPRSQDRSAILVDSVPRNRSAPAKTPAELHVLLAQAATFSESQKRAESRRRLRTSQVIALTAVVLGVAALPVDREQPTKVHTAYKSSSASAAPDRRNSGAELISLSSDQYVVFPNKRMAELSVQRTHEARGDTGFVWWTTGSGAKPNEDYIGGPPKLAQMPDGIASVKLFVPILANPSRRHIEMFYVLIGKLGGGAHLGPIRRAAVFIMPGN